MSNKTVNGKRKASSDKMLQKTARRVGVGSPQRSDKDVGLKEQYSIIREDIMKLREDLAKGYSLTRNWLDKKSVVRNLLKAK